MRSTVSWRPSKALVALGVVILTWGAGYLAIGLAMSPAGGFGPLWFGSTRLVLAGLLLLGFAAWRRHDLVPTRGEALLLVGLGFLGWTVGSGLQITAQRTVPSGLTALIMGAVPALAVGLAAIRDRRAPTVPQIAAVALGLVGIAFLVGDVPAAGGATGAAGLLLVAAFAWALQSVLVGVGRGVSPLVSGAWQMLAGGLGLGLVGWLSAEPWPTPTGLGWATWWFMCVPCAAIGFPLWLYILRRLPMHVAMTQSTLSPMVALILAWSVRGEMLGPTALVGMVLALGGAWLAVRAPGHAPEPAPAWAPDSRW